LAVGETCRGLFALGEVLGVLDLLLVGGTVIAGAAVEEEAPATKVSWRVNT
jgi:hypothetical protein